MVRELLVDQLWRGRLINGSDYPFPGSPLLTSLNRIVELGFLSAQDAQDIGHFQGHNPLLFDFALKRLLRIDGHPVAPEIFQCAPLFREQIHR